MPRPAPARVVVPVPVFVFAAALAAQGPPASAQPRPVMAIGSVAHPREALAATAPAAAATIGRGLAWLLAQQRPDGRWDSDAVSPDAGRPVYDVAVTGLALLALAREGTAARPEPRHDAMLRGAHWLALQQQENGLLGTKATHDFIYGHAIATFALAAVTAATGSAEARQALGGGITYLAAHRNPFMVWRYMPRDGDNDTSVTAWATMACLAARELGLPVDENGLASVRGYLAQVTDAHGRAGYTRAGEPSSRQVQSAQRFPPANGEAMTAAAIWCRHALGADAADAQLAAGAALLLAKPPSWEPDAGKVDLCYWFFAGEALRRVGAPAARTPWDQQLIAALQQGQRLDGEVAGSWDPRDPWGEDGGRLYSTALAVLALQALYDVPALTAAAAPAQAPAPK
ncbi:MAG: terpene cyclase/mutase family protein [Planctomycetes bacterium]|nr:terpene cyclase/mutase family protein [Planctomycetota bacterium]